ncbi:hypothetical protein QBC35DRAFT_508371 [Podospora australis]|uniref:Uncharacterized protein n=1 Tax=Podospora australis TaxID=1536484 RepID=A0AAN6WJZ4_9PEZI|nr:hypothetical protein QBC35DRAFT_508371 [Podospora australis]
MPALAATFNRPLPVILPARDAVSELRVLSDQPDSTRPPAWWVEVDVANYVHRADAYLNLPPVQTALQSKTTAELDPLAKLRSEADVVDYGNQQLLYHIDAALGIQHARSLDKVAEYPVGNKRVDVAWRRSNDSKAVAVLEYKKSGSIVKSEFDGAKMRLRAGDCVESLISQKKLEADRLPGNVQRQTFFSGTSISLMQQIATYSQRSELSCNYLSLFDSNYLFLGVFGPDPYYLQGTLLTVQGTTDGALVRKALLGYLLCAWDADRSIPPTNIRAPYYGEIYATRSGGKTASNSVPAMSGSTSVAGKAHVSASKGVGSATSTLKAAGGPTAKAVATPKQNTAAAAAPTASTTRVGTPGTLPIRTSPAKKPKIDPKTKKPVIGKDGKPVYD